MFTFSGFEITRIVEGYKNIDVNFGEHYVSIYFGCGADCIMGFMVDAVDGKIYHLPLGEENMSVWSVDKAIYKKDSRLFISSIGKKNQKSRELEYIAFVWDEEVKHFDEVKRPEFLVLNNTN